MIGARKLERSKLAADSVRQPLPNVLIVLMLLAALLAVGSWAWLAFVTGGAEEVLLAPFRWGPGHHSAGMA